MTFARSTQDASKCDGEDTARHACHHLVCKIIIIPNDTRMIGDVQDSHNALIMLIIQNDIKFIFDYLNIWILEFLIEWITANDACALP